MTLLASYIDNFAGVKALCIGDIMLDRFLYGKVNRISPEAPVPVFFFEREKQMLGGAGNTAANMAALGCRVTFVGIIGRDENGRKLTSLLSETGVHSHLLRLENYPTIVKTRLIAGNNHLLRADQEEILPVIESLLPRFERILERAVKNADVVVLSDYNKGLLTPVTAQLIIRLCSKYDKPVIIDPKGSDYTKYRNAVLVKPNLKEFAEATGRQYNPKDADFAQQVRAGAEALFAKYRIKNLLITLSEHGMIFVSADNAADVLQIPTEAKEVFDVSGAGDTSLAALGASLGCGVPLKDAMKLANLAAGIAVGKLGTACVSARELKNALSRKETPEDGWVQKRKIITADEAEALIRDLKKQGKTSGFTNGCFDCLHLGHLHSFMQAKKECDVLFVGVNADESVRRLKGSSRPLQDEKTRAMLLASLEFIDYVIVFNEDTALPLVEKLRPDVIAKEGYAPENWPEARYVTSYGGRAVTLRRLDGYSTSNFVAKMKG